MIQRIQSVYLFLAAIAMTVFMFMPVMLILDLLGNGHVIGAIAGVGDSAHTIDTTNYIFLILDVLVTVLSLVTIFKFKNLKSQSSLCKITLTLTIALIVVIVMTWFIQKGNNAIAALTPWFALPCVTLIMLMLAHSGIKKDRKLLAESDRLR